MSSLGTDTGLVYQVIKSILCDTTAQVSDWAVSNHRAISSCLAFPRRLEIHISDGPPHLCPHQVYRLGVAQGDERLKPSPGHRAIALCAFPSKRSEGYTHG